MYDVAANLHIQKTNINIAYFPQVCFSTPKKWKQEQKYGYYCIFDFVDWRIGSSSFDEVSLISHLLV